MKVGVSLFANNGPDVDRFAALEAGQGEPIGDGVDNQVWEEELRFGDLVEPLGFDSIWTVEHHFSPYTMICDPLQWLTYWAARTDKVDLGTMVIVLPWHNPVRVAEEIVMLQHMMGDNRQLICGFGRGAGRREYGGIGADMNKTRELFEESVYIIKGLIGNERFAFQSDVFKVPNVEMRPESPDLSIRPRPRNSQALIDNFHIAWGSPQTVAITANLGLKPLIIPQRGMVDYVAELQEFNGIRMNNGFEPANCGVHLHIMCTETEAEAEAMMPYELSFGHSAMVNYEFGSSHFSSLKGYEHYAQMQERMKEMAEQAAAAGQPQGSVPFTFPLNPGTPDQIMRGIEEVCDYVHPNHLLGVFKFGGMPFEVAEKSMRLFAKECLPALQEMKVLDPIVGDAGAAAT
jgi:alkanesulfonate monooxygenase SsuD/methylene tetrahydromethanopterin reductase-like flavin-dependent oxidoreductase (luciferase family)